MRTAWARSSISSRTTWASASRSINGGWTSWKTAPARIYAPYFDIQWKPLKSDLQDKVLLPILGDQYGRVLERGELQVRFEAGAFYLRYYDHEFPIAPGTYRHILEIALEKLAPFKKEDFYAEFQSIITALEYLPRRTETDPERIAERAREKEIIKRRLERRCQEAPQVQAAVMQARGRNQRQRRASRGASMRSMSS